MTLPQSGSAWRLARVDAERQKLADRLAELDAAERVLSRFSRTKATTPQRARPVRGAEATEPAAAPARRGRAGGGHGKGKAKPSMGLEQSGLGQRTGRSRKTRRKANPRTT